MRFSVLSQLLCQALSYASSALTQKGIEIWKLILNREVVLVRVLSCISESHGMLAALERSQGPV